LGKTAGIVFSFSLSILILVASILIFFISDIRFNLISFSKAKRDEARKILFNKKNSNLKVKTVYQTPKISQNVAKTESKIEDQLESDIAIKTNATNKNNENIHLKHSNEIETKSPDLVAAQITKNAILDSKNEVKEIIYLDILFVVADGSLSPTSRSYRGGERCERRAFVGCICTDQRNTERSNYRYRWEV